MSTNSRFSLEDDMSELNEGNTMPRGSRVLEDEEVWRDEDMEIRESQGEEDIGGGEDADPEAAEFENREKGMDEDTDQEVLGALEEEEDLELEMMEAAPAGFGKKKKKRRKPLRPHRTMLTHEEIGANFDGVDLDDVWDSFT